MATIYAVNEAGVNTGIILPKGQEIEIDVDAFNRPVKLKRILPGRIARDPATGSPRVIPAAAYETRYRYCRNMKLDREERDICGLDGRPLWGGIESRTYGYDGRDNVVSERIGGAGRDGGLVTRHVYDESGLRAATVRPEGNRNTVDYDERQQPIRIVRGKGTDGAAIVKIGYDGDGLISSQTDGCGFVKRFTYDAFGRAVRIDDYDLNDDMFRSVRQDFDKTGNLIIQRLFTPAGPVQAALSRVLPLQRA
jgi:YD repeat-containing protein